MIHTYSLIHDDLPALDDDGKPTGRQCVELSGDDGKSIRPQPNYRVNVRPASGPRRSSWPSCRTPAASEANTSGITTKNSIRRNT